MKDNPSINKLIHSAVEKITTVEKFLGGLCFAVLTILMALDVFSRETLNEGIDWAQKGAIILMIWGGILGASLTTHKGGHLRPEIADKLWGSIFGDSYKPTFKIIEYLIISAFCVFMFYLSLDHIVESKEMGDIHPVLDGLPLWVIKIVFPYVFVSMAIRNFIFAIYPDLRPVDNPEIANALQEFDNEEVSF